MEMTKVDSFLADLDTDEAHEFFAANPRFYDGLKSLIHQPTSRTPSPQDDYDNKYELISEEKYARNTHSWLLKLVANSNLGLVDRGIVPLTTEAGVERIIHAQHEVPLGSPLPLLWPTYHSSAWALTGSPSRLSASDSDDSDDPGLSRSRVDDLVHRLAVTSAPNFAYRPDLFNTRLGPTEAAAIAASPHTITLPGPHWWSYGTLYTVDYEDATGMTDFCEKLEQMDLKLPEIVLSLGRLVVTSDRVTNHDGSSWSASDYGVMVDMQTEGKPVWLICDSHVAGKLRDYNSCDGTPEDKELVRSLFNPGDMDMALLFPRIDDWECSDNTWPALHGRISETAVKLGLHLRNL